MLKDKALASLAAGDLLVERGFPDDAASRYYYAMYRAAVHALTVQGRRPGQFRSGAVDWDHSMVENNAGLIRKRFEDRMLYRDMREMRVLADYRPGSVNVGDLRRCRPEVAAFVKELTR
jgi:uncharacterized protein (UPF0332 family)